MSDSKSSLPAAHFEHIYAGSTDPWNFETSEYERGKYAATLNALPRSSYRSGLEVGCSIGVLSKLLATRCDRLLGLDVADRALDLARERCVDLKHVSFARTRVPQEFPGGSYDLIVLSEVAYYWTLADLHAAADGLAPRHLPGGTLVLVHLTEWIEEHPLSGDAVHEAWLQRSEWKSIHEERHARFRLNVLERCA